MKTEIEQAIAKVCQDLFDTEIEPVLTRPDEQFGDYATNVALQLSQKLGQNPKEIAAKLVDAIKSPAIKKTEVAGPGFINIWLSDEALIESLDQKIAQTTKGQEILVEFGDPNPFKAMHIGHLYSYIVGDAIAALLEATGAVVRRLSYHGDVGRHVARAIYGMRQEKIDIKDPNLNELIKTNIGYYYTLGVKADEDEKDDSAKHEIDDINEHIYKEDDPEINALYNLGSKGSFANFDLTLEDIGVNPDNIDRFLESKAAPIGIKIVEQNIGKVFTKSDDAIIYEGEKAGLHTRVFITSKGLPTYEAKDLGLTELKDQKYPKASQSIIITANEQAEYFKVMLAALAEINPSLAKKTKHLSHGFVSLSSGKMSSRTGNVYSGVSAIVDIERSIEALSLNKDKDIRNAAIKYDFLKHRLGSNVIYDVAESFSLQGNSGPYLQYAHARARSILSKSKAEDSQLVALDSSERSLVRKIGEYSEAVDKAIGELMPHHVCTYLYELAQTFNRFYESNRVIDDPRETVRLKLVKAYADTLKNGLELLNIHAPEKM